jgi:hypothetical protein
MVIWSICAANYIAKALLLADSIRQTHNGTTIALYIAERYIQHDTIDRLNSHVDSVFPIDSLAHYALDRLAFTHTVLEFATALKAIAARDVCNRFPDHDIFVYLDPDMEVFGPFSELTTTTTSSVTVTPVAVTTACSDDTLLSALRTGTYNLGFLGLRPGSNSDAFMTWFADKLAKYCYVDTGRGLFVDQKWIDVAMALFDIDRLLCPGYNVAYWNLSERHLSQSGDEYSVNGEPLRCVHFSGIDLGNDMRATKTLSPESRDVFLRIRSDYKRRLMKAYVDFPLSTPWSYDYFYSGEHIGFETRMLCRMNPRLLRDCTDPFAESNEFFHSRA